MILKGVPAAANRPNGPDVGVLLDNLLDKFQSPTHSLPCVMTNAFQKAALASHKQVYVNSTCVKRGIRRGAEGEERPVDFRAAAFGQAAGMTGERR